MKRKEKTKNTNSGLCSVCDSLGILNPHIFIFFNFHSVQIMNILNKNQKRVKKTINRNLFIGEFGPISITFFSISFGSIWSISGEDRTRRNKKWSTVRFFFLLKHGQILFSETQSNFCSFVMQSYFLFTDRTHETKVWSKKNMMHSQYFFLLLFCSVNETKERKKKVEY